MSFPAAVARSLLIATACAALSSGACARSSDRAAERVAGQPQSTVRAAAERPSAIVVADTDDFGAAMPTDARYGARVVSLNPTATEVIFAIGAQSRLVGRSRWDEFPAEAASIPALGDGIRPNVEAVLGARPTLVVLYATAENRAAADALQRAGVRTMALRVDHIAQFVSLCQRLGIALDATVRARSVTDSVQHTLDRVREAMRGVTPVTVVWPLWRSPVLVVGRGSYLDELIGIAGGTNVFHDQEAPSPAVSIEEIAKRNPDVLIATAKTSAELRTSSAWNAVAAVREQHLRVDDPAITGRPSVVLGMAAVSLARLLHPERAAALP